MTANGYKVYWGADKDVLKLDYGDGYTTLKIGKALHYVL